MLKLLSNRKAQTTLEYAILIGVIVAGLIAMQTYVKRGFQGKLRSSADSMGEQFSPDNTTYTYTTTQQTSTTEDFKGGVTTSDILRQSTRKTGSEQVAESAQETWFNK